jgi:hypothetical protein
MIQLCLDISKLEDRDGIISWRVIIFFLFRLYFVVFMLRMIAQTDTYIYYYFNFQGSEIVQLYFLVHATSTSTRGLGTFAQSIRTYPCTTYPPLH